MAEASTTPKQANPVPNQGDHDRVQMLSLKADGTPDQHNPEMIGDKETSVEATKQQFAEQAVSAVDVTENTGPVTLVGQKDGTVKEEPLTTGEDPQIAERQKAHDKAAKAAESAAEKAVNSLHQG